MLSLTRIHLHLAGTSIFPRNSVRSLLIELCKREPSIFASFYIIFLPFVSRKPAYLIPLFPLLMRSRVSLERISGSRTALWLTASEWRAQHLPILLNATLLKLPFVPFLCRSFYFVLRFVHECSYVSLVTCVLHNRDGARWTWLRGKLSINQPKGDDLLRTENSMFHSSELISP